MTSTENFELAEAFRLEQKKETKAKACPVASGMFQSASTLISSSDDEATDEGPDDKPTTSKAAPIDRVALIISNIFLVESAFYEHDF